MIKKTKRLKKGDIDYLLKKGQEGRTKLFLIRKGKNQENFSQYCVIISAKISNKATFRNKLRRQIYEIIDKIEKVNPPKESLNIVLIPKKQIINANFSDIEEDLKKLLKKL